MARLAFLGLGRMGSGMAQRLLAHGHALSVWNRTPSKMAALADRGARACATPAEACTGAEAIFCMVADDDASREAWLGAHGALTAAVAADALAIECSTVSHPWSQQLAAACRERGLRPIDCPVTGLPDMAAAGTLTLLVGAEPAHVDAARDILGAVATTIHHFGPHGTGTIYKLLVNLLGAIQIASAAEALALAERAGLDPALVTRALSTGQAASPQVVRHLRRFAGDETSQDVTFTAALRLKDTRYGAALFRELGQASAFGDAAVALYERLCAMGLGESTESRIIDLFRK